MVMNGASLDTSSIYHHRRAVLTIIVRGGRVQPSYANEPRGGAVGPSCWFKLHQVIVGCRLVKLTHTTTTYCTALLRNISVLLSTYFMRVSAQTPSRPHGCHLKYACALLSPLTQDPAALTPLNFPFSQVRRGLMRTKLMSVTHPSKGFISISMLVTFTGSERLQALYL